MGWELGGKMSSECLLGGMSRTVASVQSGDHPCGECRDGHDHSRFILKHMSCGQARGQKVRPRVARDRQGELLDIQLDQRDTQSLRIPDPGRVERDIDATRLVDHGLQMLVHGLLVKSVDLRRLRGSAGGKYFLGDRLDRRLEAPGEKKLGPLAREGACDSTADRTSGSVDHRNFVLQHHLWFLSGPGWSHTPTS